MFPTVFHTEDGQSMYRNVYSSTKSYVVNMKLIVIALLFKFIISCWPKVDIIKG